MQLPPTSPKPAAKGSAPEDDEKAGSPATNIKAWGEACSALLKALVLALAIGIVAAVAGTAIWRDQRARHVLISVDAETEKALRALGSELDLRQVLVDSLNDEVRGVQAIVALNYPQLVDAGNTGEVSFKPFGLDATTGQLTQIFREVMGSKPHASVRVELMCAPLPCASQAADGARLLVTISDGDGSQRVTFPIRTAQPALRRSLRKAMQRSAELLLERSQPMIASVYHFNAAAQRRFIDDYVRDHRNAMGAALRVRSADGTATCVANLVIGGSLMRRGSIEDGLRVERQAGEAADPVCRIHAATNLVVLLANPCDEDPLRRSAAFEQARQAMAPLATASTSGVGELVRDRIPASELFIAQWASLLRPGNEAVRVAYCGGSTVASAGAGNTIAADVMAMLKTLPGTLPPRPTQQASHGTLEGLVRLYEAGIPASDGVTRIAVAREIMRTIDLYLASDPWPRGLFLLRGRMAMAMAHAEFDAFGLAPAARRAALAAAGTDVAAPGFDEFRGLVNEFIQRSSQARVDFENALVAGTAAPLVDPPREIEAWTRLGDAQLLSGNPHGAAQTYGRAVDAFVDADAPVDEVIDLAKAIARLAVLHAASGACRTPAPLAPADAAWRRRGFTPGDLCKLAAGDAATTAATDVKPTLIDAIRPLLLPAMTCAALPLAVGKPSFGRDAFALHECLQGRGADVPSVAQAFALSQSGSAVDAAVERALGSAL